MRRVTVWLLAVLMAGAAPAAAGPTADLDPSFGGDGLVTAFTSGAVATAVAVDAEDRIVIAGYTIDDQVDLALARFLPTGELDDTFSGDGRVRWDLGQGEFAFDMVLDAAGRPVIAGKTSTGLDEAILVARLGTDGTPDATFGGGDGVATIDLGKPYQSAGAVALTPGGRIVTAGYVSVGTTSNMVVVRSKADGSPDLAFGRNGVRTLNLSDGAEQLTDVLVTPAGRVFAAGHAEVAAIPRFVAVKLTAGGDRDPTFSGDGVATVSLGPGADVANALTWLPTGKVVLAGRAANGGANDWGLIRLGPGGGLDPTFHHDGIRFISFPGQVDEAFALTPAGGGKVWVAGRAMASTDDLAVVRLRGGGGLDPAFSVDGRASVDGFGGADAARDLAVQPDGNVVLAGEAEATGTVRAAVARILSGAAA
jgi:uncharacterized delta-60 repeat protein